MASDKSLNLQTAESRFYFVLFSPTICNTFSVLWSLHAVEMQTARFWIIENDEKLSSVYTTQCLR